MTTYADIPALETVWLVRNRLPRGEVVLIAGEGGTGKGMSMCDLAAAVTTGRDWAGEPVVATGSVVMITPEDDLNETVAYRLRAVSADLGKIHDLTFMHGGAPFELSVKAGQFGSIPQLRELIDAIGDVVLVIIDPLMAAVDGPISSNVAARRVMSPLQRMAKETGVCVAMTHHTVKSGAVAGSKGLVDAARLVYRLAKDPANPAIRVLSMEKSNITSALEDVRYAIDGGGLDARVVWLGREELDSRRIAWREKARPAVAAMQPQAPPQRYSVIFRSQYGMQKLDGPYPSLRAAQMACLTVPAMRGRPEMLPWQQADERTWTANLPGSASSPSPGRPGEDVSARGRPSPHHLALNGRTL